MIALLAIAAFAGPPDGLSGTWSLVRVEGPKETWDYADKVVEWKKYGTGRCAETRREVVLEGDSIAVRTRWTSFPRRVGPYRSASDERSSSKSSGAKSTTSRPRPNAATIRSVAAL